MDVDVMMMKMMMIMWVGGGGGGGGTGCILKQEPTLRRVVGKMTLITYQKLGFVKKRLLP